MDAVGYRIEQKFQELPCCLAVCLFYQLGHCKLAGSVNGNKEMEHSLFCSDLGDAYMEEADWAALELLPFWFVALDIQQPRYPVPLQATVQRRTRQMWDRRSQSVEAVIKWQQSMPPESGDNGFVFCAKNS